MKVLRVFYMKHHKPTVCDESIKYKKEACQRDFPIETNKEEAKFIIQKEIGVPPKMSALQSIEDKIVQQSFADGFSFTETESDRCVEKIGNHQDVYETCLFDPVTWFGTFSGDKRK